MKIRSWDIVKILSWKREDKGKEAKVLKVLPSTNKIIVEGVNIASRHYKKSWTTPGQIVKIEKAIDASSVALVCPFTKLPTRIWYVLVEEKGQTKKYRYSKAAVKKEGKEAKNFIIK
jgi:large subunit ribosomal protein L24